MKKIILAVSAMAAVAAAAQSTIFKGMTQEEVKEHDKVTWGNGVAMTDKVKTEYDELVGRMEALDKALEKAGDEKAFCDATREETLKTLFGLIQTPLVKNKKRVNAPPEKFKGKEPAAGEDYGERGMRALDSLTLMMDRFDKNSRWKLMELVDFALVAKLSQRYTKWTRIIERINVWKHSKTLEEFDAAFGKFMAIVAALPRGEEPSPTFFASAMRKSGLDRFATAECQKEAFFDRDLRTIDSYLAPLRDVACNAYKENLGEFSKKWQAALEAMRSDYAYFKEHGLNLRPKDRKRVDSLMDAFSYLMLHAKDYTEKAEKLIASVNEGGSEIGRLRTCEIGSHKAFDCAGPVQSNGCPGYTRRVRVALEDCKNAYKKATR